MPATPTFMEIFGFSVPVLPGGRRIWSPRFKRLITERMDAGDLTSSRLPRNVMFPNLIYQWRMQARGKPVGRAARMADISPATK
ncbi:transposase [Paracoccus aminovorans]|uniref:transposase n=1 Tax=Paracoccus aminovorans TaxID=34004 RepID=UPI002B262F1A|nr:transposase [Paracoccus aminovorans]